MPKKTGCHYLVYAPESGFQNTLQSIKKLVDLKKFMNAALTARQLGIVVRFNLIVGFSNETRMDVFRTIIFSLKAARKGIDKVSVNLLLPYPGFALLASLHEKSVISLSDDYFLKLASLKSEYTFLNPLTVNSRIGPRELGIYRLALIIHS